MGKRQLSKVITKEGINNEMVNYYLSQMMNGTFTNKKISVMKYNNDIYITDGHSRMVAAYNYYQKTGDTFYIDLLLDNAKIDYVNPAEYGYFKHKKIPKIRNNIFEA